MKTLPILILCMSLVIACKSGAQQSNPQANQKYCYNAAPRTPPSNEVDVVMQEDVFEGRLTPTAIEGCLRKVSVGEPFEFDLSLNPFYLRLNLYGQGVNDYAIVIRGKNTKKLGLLICKDAKEPLVLGELSNPKVPLTDMDNDNFIASYWDVADRDEFKKLSHYEGRFKAPGNAKGEILVFYYAINGVLYIWWDGKKFQTFSE